MLKLGSLHTSLPFLVIFDKVDFEAKFWQIHLFEAPNQLQMLSVPRWLVAPIVYRGSVFGPYFQMHCLMLFLVLQIILLKKRELFAPLLYSSCFGTVSV